jgi:DNA-binding MarR family transcriptional regulator
MFWLREVPSKQNLKSLSLGIPDVDIPSIEAYLLFIRTATVIFTEVEDRLSYHGLSQSKFALLMLLYNHLDEGLHPSELAIHAGVRKSTITGLLGGLERTNYIKKECVLNDRRMVKIKLTETGKKVIDEILPEHLQSLTTLMGCLNAKEKQNFVELLEKINRMAPTIKR